MLVARLEEGYDIVCGWRKDRKDTLVTRRIPSIIANKLISRATGVRPARLRLLAEGLPQRGREAAAPLRRDAPLHPGDRERVRREGRRGGRQPPRASRRHLQVRAVAHHPGDPRPGHGEVPAELRHATAADLRPGRRDPRRPRRGDHGRTSRSCACSCTTAIADRPLLLFGILLVSSGLQLLTMGLLAELQARTYHESQDKPTYAIRDIVEASAEHPGARAPCRWTSAQARGSCHGGEGPARARRADHRDPARAVRREEVEGPALRRPRRRPARAAGP